jgi:outer membrane protein assembly factor BamB
VINASPPDRIVATHRTTRVLDAFSLLATLVVWGAMSYWAWTTYPGTRARSPSGTTLSSPCRSVILACFDAKTGKLRYRTRLGSGGSGFTASPILSDGNLYLTSEEGDVHVVRAGPEFELLAVNPLGETCMATPAASEGTLYWRTRSHLVAVGD